MITISYNEETLYLWPHRHDWGGSSEPSLQLEIPSVRTVSIGRRETRRATGLSLRVPEAEIETWIDGLDVAEFRLLAIDRGDTRIAFPLWQFEQEQTSFASSPIYGGLNLTYDIDHQGEILWSAGYEIHTGRSPSTAYEVSDNTFTVPLLIGYIDDPGPEAETDEEDSLSIKFSESSAAEYALQCESYSWQNGPELSDGTVLPLFPFFDDCNNAIKTVLGVDLQKIDIGDAREKVVVWRGQIGQRLCSMNLSLESVDEVARFIAFFLDQAGLVGAFWLPSGQFAARLTANTSADSITVEVEDTSPLGDHDYVVFGYLGSGLDPVWIPRRVISKTDTTLTLDSSPGELNYRKTVCWRLDLVRFNRAVVQLQFHDICSANLVARFATLPKELDLPAGSVRGSTIGALPPCAYVYDYSMELDDTLLHWRYTNWESDVQDSGNAVTHKIIEHTGTIASTRLKSDPISINMEVFDGNPLSLISDYSAQRPLYLTIRKGSIEGSTFTLERVVFTGEVTKSPIVDGIYNAEAIAGGRFLDAPIPAMRFQRVCTVGLFSSGCGLDRSDWRFDGTVFFAGHGDGYPFELVITDITRYNGGDLPDFAAGYFAWGEIEIGDGLNYQGQGIASSTAIFDDNRIKIMLDGPMTEWPTVGTAVRIYPGCYGNRSACQNKFNNFANWKGAQVADSNLSLIEVSKSSSGGK